MSTTDFDVIVIGSGAAGLSAALAAVEQGAGSVLVVESEDVVGGSSRLSGGVVMGSGSELQRAAGIEDAPGDLFKEYMALNHWDVAAGPVERWCVRSGETIDWLVKHGVRFFDRLIFGGDERKPRSHCVDGGGQGLIDALHSSARRSGVEIALGRRVHSLLVEDDVVCGVTSNGESLTAAAVVVATGGFGNNPERLAKHYPTAWIPNWTWYIGAAGARGDALDFAKAIGAQTFGVDRGLRTLDPGLAKLNEAFLPGWAVLLDSNGRRFTDETAPYGILDTLVGARGNKAYVLFDDAALRPPADKLAKYRDAYKQVWPNHAPFRPKNYTADMIDDGVKRGIVRSADTIAILAEMIGLPSVHLVGEIDRYNALVEAGVDSDFGKAGKFLVPISTAPFYAVEVRPVTVNHTGFGLRIDEYGRVIGEDGRVIEGLYAAGECTGGIAGITYMGSGSSLASACGFGRIAGEEAAQRARQAA
jgi:fumarate reductase flavoprotein subunit